MHVEDSEHMVVQENPSSSYAGTNAAQGFIDNLIERALLRFIPGGLHPNHLTILRLLLTPAVILLLYTDHRIWAFAVFVIAACTDFLDGALARTRDQVTKVGMILDPLADKLLIGSTLAWLGYTYLVVQIILAFIGLEIIMMGVGAITSRSGRRVRPANVFGKTKMIVQSIAVILFLIAGIFEFDNLLTISLYMLWVAIFLAVLSGVRQIFDWRDAPE